MNQVTCFCYSITVVVSQRDWAAKHEKLHENTGDVHLQSGLIDKNQESWEFPI